jgi:hypothetical protein
MSTCAAYLLKALESWPLLKCNTDAKQKKALALEQGGQNSYN